MMGKSFWSPRLLPHAVEVGGPCWIWVVVFGSQSSAQCVVPGLGWRTFTGLPTTSRRNGPVPKVRGQGSASREQIPQMTAGEEGGAMSRPLGQRAARRPPVASVGERAEDGVAASSRRFSKRTHESRDQRCRRDQRLLDQRPSRVLLPARHMEKFIWS